MAKIAEVQRLSSRGCWARSSRTAGLSRGRAVGPAHLSMSVSRGHMDHETELVSAFVLSAKRARLLGFIRGFRRRRKLLETLYHFRDLDPRFVVEIAPSDQHAEAIAGLLARRGAPSLCHVISTDRELDGRDLPLAEALRQIVGRRQGALVSCVPGRLGFFEGESPNDRFILDRPPA
jgi:hypothetical protein